MPPHLAAGSIDIYELKQLIKWCELGYKNAEFWRRWTLASMVYDERTRLAMLELAAIAQQR